VLEGKLDFVLFFCHSDAGGITLFFCGLLYEIPPSSERQTGSRKDKLDVIYFYLVICLFGYLFNRLFGKSV
jgi:hypothetical protein